MQNDIKNTDFDWHWENNYLETASLIKIKEAENFFTPVISILKKKPIKVLDAGCGDGVHWFYLRGLNNNRLNYTGIDSSGFTISKLKMKKTEMDNFYQMDISSLNLKNHQYDIVFSFGVIAYTNKPEKSFDELCRICRPGGWIGVWIYPEPHGIAKYSFNITRYICRIGGKFISQRIADFLVPFLGILPTRSKINLLNSTWKECREVILVNIAPTQLKFFSRDIILTWFKNNLIKIKYEDNNNPITLWGKKQI